MASHSWLAVLAAAAWLFGVAVASSPDASIDVEEPIRILVCVTNVENANERLQDLARMFDSVMRRARHRPLHWILLVKPGDVAVVDPLLRHITTAQAKVESRIEYVDLNAIINHFSAPINLTRTHLLCTDPLHKSRFWNEVFHIGNLHHLIFPFRRLVVLDLDLVFEVDIADQYREFESMERDDRLVAITYDQAQHYWVQFQRFRKKHHGTRYTKGFNTGVLLMDLERMRRSRLYNSYLERDQLLALITKYEWQGCIGYQDFFTLLGVEHPQLFRVLDCTWNRQLDVGLGLTGEGADLFDHFHRCDGPIKVWHTNGKSTLPGDDIVTWLSPDQFLFGSFS